MQNNKKKPKSSQDFIELISFRCQYGLELNKDRKSLHDYVSPKYHKGAYTAYEWFGRVVWEYIKKEQELKDELEDILVSKKRELRTLKEGHYKMGLLDALKELEYHVKKEKKV